MTNVFFQLYQLSIFALSKSIKQSLSKLIIQKILSLEGC
jgi:hypothetical protein